MSERQETALNPRFAEILRRERSLSELSLTCKVERVRSMAQEYKIF